MVSIRVINHRTLFLILLFACPAFAQTPFRAGMVTRNFFDEQRRNWEEVAPRPLRTAVWYPAAATTTESETIFGGPPDKEVFAPVTVASGAQISPAKQKYPLVVLSHGTGGSAVTMIWLGTYLAARGYIVAAVNHHGNTAIEKPTPQGFMLIWERARDLSVLLDKLLADPFFGGRIDRDRISAAGFSLGGYTAITIAGGRFSISEFESFCRSPRRDFTCDPQPEFPEATKLFEELRKTDAVVKQSVGHAGDSFLDRRVKRVFAIAPAMGAGFTKAGLKEIKVPIFLVVGQADKVTPAATNAQHYAQLIKGAKLKILPGEVSHYTFLAECNEHGRSILEICRDAASVNRGKIHQEVAQLAFEFFEIR